MNPIELEDYPGFYEISGYSRYGISITGEVIRRADGKYLQGSRNPKGYFNFRLIGDNGKVLTWGRHRLMCFVFKHPGYPIDNLVVNHKNCIKGDDFLDNLEWETYTGNAEHAGYNQLTSKCVPVLVRDSVTGIVIEFPSAIKCALNLGLTKDAVLWRIMSKGQKVFPDGRQYKRLHDEEDWFIPGKELRKTFPDRNGKVVLVRELLTGKIKSFSKLKTLAMLLGTNQSKLTLWLKQENQPVLPGYIQVKLASDPKPWRHVEDPYLELDLYTKKRSVVVIDDTCESIEIFPQCTDAARKFDISPTLLDYRLKRPDRAYGDGYRFMYYSDYAARNNGPVNQ